MHITLDTKTLVQMFFDLVPNEQRSTERVFDGVFDALEKEANKTNKTDLVASLGKARTPSGARCSGPTGAASATPRTTCSTTSSRRTACRAVSCT
jgi:hypothetical protein